MEWFSLPDDTPRIVALAAALLAPLLMPLWLRRRPDKAVWVLAPLCAALLSTGYIDYYLRGGPRIIDATAYWLQARALADGMLSFPIGDPEHAVLGRFLLRAANDSSPAASVIFPPGYPAVLSLGFMVGAPLAVGPVLAAAITYATMDLARRVARLGSAHIRKHETLLVRIAAVSSVLCATLRYHTADTMSHGLAALCMTVSLSAALATCAPGSAGRAAWRFPLIAGAAAGLLFATRPASAVALTLTMSAIALWMPRAGGAVTPRAMLAFAAGAAAPIALWLAHNAAATGSIATTPQSAYYALSDGPPSCFRYGFGASVGCLGEHGDFVRNRLPDGYGALAALGTTGRRLKMHLADPLNFAPLFPLIVLGMASARRVPVVRVLCVAVLAQIACYAPFYFDGNYPGGGARMYADVLPLEHVLASLGVLTMTPRPRPDRPARPLMASMVIALGLVGFAFRGGMQHQQLRDREGGLPMYQASAKPTGTNPELWFFDTDHGFNLAYAPGGGARKIARFHGDDVDRLAWERAGRPAAYRYRYGGAKRQPSAWLEPLSFDSAPTATLGLRIEGESLWPPAGQRDGWAWPSHFASACVSGGQALALYPTSDTAQLRVRLPADLAGRALTLGLLLGISESRAKNRVTMSIYSGTSRIHSAAIEHAGGPECRDSKAVELPPSAAQLSLVIHAREAVAIDSLKFSEKR